MNGEKREEREGVEANGKTHGLIRYESIENCKFKRFQAKSNCNCQTLEVETVAHAN